MLRTAFALCLLIAGLKPALADQWWRESYDPSRRPTEAGQSQQSNSYTANKPTENHKDEAQTPPLVVDLLNPPNGSSITEELAKDREQRASDNKSVWIFSLFLVIVGIAQAGAIIYTALVTNKAANAAKDAANATTASVTLAEKTAKQELRAYLCVRTAQIASPDGGNNFQAEIEIFNAGQTPAHRVTHRIAADLQIQHGPPLTFPLPEIEPEEVPIGPSIPYTLRKHIGIGGPSGRGTIDIGQRIIFVWGRVDYFDIFGDPQHLEFRFRSADAVRVHDNTVMQTVGWIMNPTKQGNSAT
jgi:hypothetical protein